MVKIFPWDEEAEAAELVARILDGEAIKRDVPGSPPSTHDYDIKLANSHVIALEVTQEVDGRLLAQYSLEAKLNWEFAELTRDWIVDIRGTVDLKKLHKKIFGLLRELEHQGLDRLNTDPREDLSPLQEEFSQLGVALVYQFGRPSGHGQVTISAAPVASSANPGLINSVVLDHANRPDNLSKLERAIGVAERHLFIWIRSDRYQLSFALRSGFLPKSVPDLPAHIDAVWVASPFDRPAIWKVDASGWRIVPKEAIRPRLPG